MTSASLDVPSAVYPDRFLKSKSVVSLDGFRLSSAPLPASRFAAAGEEDPLYELAEMVQTDGTKAAILGNIQKIKEIVTNLKKHSSLYLIDLTTEEDGYNMLHFAVCYKKIKVVEFLTENGANVECTTKDNENDTPLMLAIRYYDSYLKKHIQAADTMQREETSATVVKFLLQHANINAGNASGTTPLALAVQKQNEAVVKLLLEDPSKILVNKHNLQSYTPLHFACAGENVKIVEILLEKGANLSNETDKGLTPIHIACRRGMVEALEAMIQKCPEVDRKKLLESKDNFGNSLLLHAKEAPTPLVFDVLVTKYHLDIHSKNNNGDGILHKFAKDDDGVLNAQLLAKDEFVSMLHEANLKRETPLHIACQQGYWKSIDHFIEKGASIKVKNAIGNTPLMTAIATGKIEVVLHMLKAISGFKQILLKDILLMDAKNEKTVLKWAIEGNHTVLIEAIIQLDLHLATESDPTHEKSFMHIAATSGSLSVIKALLNSRHIRQLLQLKDNDRKTPLMLAAQHGHIECVKALHAPGVMYTTDENENVEDTDGTVLDLNAVDIDGNTAFNLACLNGHFPVVHYLSLCGANLEACNGEDGTPLACAASKGHVKIVNYLLGQDVDINGGYTVTPLIVAAKNGHEKCVKQLLQHPNVNVTIQDEDGYNCLALAALNRHLEAALAIINSPEWEKALKCCDKYNSTPMRLLIQHIPDAAEVVLYRCIKKIQNHRGEVTAIEMSFEFLDDFKDPSDGIYGFLNTVVFRNGADPSTTIGRRTIDQALWRNNTAPSKFNRHNHVLEWMVKYERTSLLQHPVTSELVSYKWKAYAMPAFMINLAIYAVFLIFLTTFAVVLPLPNELMCREKKTDCSDDPGIKQVFLRFAGTVLLVYCVVRSLIELLQLLQRGTHYVTGLENYMEILLIISTVIFATSGQAESCFCVESYSWQFGVLAVFLAWIDLVLYLKKLPPTGIPINMLQSVVVTFVKLIYLPAILIVAFAIPFYMLFSRPEIVNSFDTPAFSLLKSLVMTSGELEYEQVYRFRDFQNSRTAVNDTAPGDLNYMAMSNILWAIFVILMPVLFANLLIALAVGDTQKVEDRATLTYLSLKVDLALEIEEKLPWIRRRLKRDIHRVEKSTARAVPCYLVWYQRLILYLFGNSFKELEKKVNDLQSEDKLLSLLQGLEVLEPIDDVKVQVQINTNAILEIKNIVDVLMKESALAAERDEKILQAIKDLKQDVKKKSTSVNYHRRNVSALVQEMIAKFE